MFWFQWLYFLLGFVCLGGAEVLNVSILSLHGRTIMSLSRGLERTSTRVILAFVALPARPNVWVCRCMRPVGAGEAEDERPCFGWQDIGCILRWDAPGGQKSFRTHDSTVYSSPRRVNTIKIVNITTVLIITNKVIYQYISYLQLILTRLMSWPWWLPSRLLVLLRVAHPPCQWPWMDSCHQTLPGGRWMENQSPGEGWIGKVTNQPSSRWFRMRKKRRNEIHWHVKGFLFSHQWELWGRLARFGNPPCFCDLLCMVETCWSRFNFSLLTISIICAWQCSWNQLVSRVHLQIKFWISLRLVLCFGLAFEDWKWQTSTLKKGWLVWQGLVLSSSRRSLIPFPQWLCRTMTISGLCLWFFGPAPIKLYDWEIYD